MRRDIGDCENSVHLNGWQSKAWALQTITKQQPKPQDFIKSQKKSSQSEDSLVVLIIIRIEPPSAERHARWCERGYKLAPTRLHLQLIRRHWLEEIHAVADSFVGSRNFNNKSVAAFAVTDIPRIKYNTAFLAIAVVVYIKITVGLFF